MATALRGRLHPGEACAAREFEVGYVKVAIFDQPGDALQCVRIADIGVPTPQAGEVLVSAQERPI